MASILSMVVTPPFEPSTSPKTSFKSSSSSLSHLLCSSCTSSLKFKAFNLSSSFNSRRILRDVKIKAQESEVSVAADTFTHFKHLLLPITDRNPYLSEGTRQAASTTAALAKKYGADITVVVIDDKPKESHPEHDTQLATIRWHLSEGGFRNLGC